MIGEELEGLRLGTPLLPTPVQAGGASEEAQTGNSGSRGQPAQPLAGSSHAHTTFDREDTAETLVNLSPSVPAQAGSSHAHTTFDREHTVETLVNSPPPILAQVGSGGEEAQTINYVPWGQLSQHLARSSDAYIRLGHEYTGAVPVAFSTFSPPSRAQTGDQTGRGQEGGIAGRPFQAPAEPSVKTEEVDHDSLREALEGPLPPATVLKSVEDQEYENKVSDEGLEATFQHTLVLRTKTAGSRAD